MKHSGIRWIAGLLILVMVLTVPAVAADRQPSAWAVESVMAAHNSGLVPVELEEDYTKPVTRAEFCALAAQLYRVWDRGHGVKGQTVENVQFTDCDDADVLLCASLGVVNGVGDGKFNPDASIRRQEAAAMLYRLAALRKDFDDTPAMPHVFDDGADLRSWARSSVYWAYENGIMQGVEENCFDPDGSYTREQSILTMLRLYDDAYAAKPEPPEEMPYHVVWDMMGPGASRVHLEDAEGNRLLTDFADTDGYFYHIDVYRDVLGLSWNGNMDHAIYVTATGQVLDDYFLEGFEEESGLGWCWKLPMYGTRTVLHADGTLGGTYTPVSGWYQGQAVVWSSSTTLSCIDSQERVLWTCDAPADQEHLYLEDGFRDRVRFGDLDDHDWLLIGRKIIALPQGVRPLVPKWSTNYICGQNGYYTLYDLDGNVLYGPHRNAMFEVGQDLYARWINDWTYEYFRCTPGGTPEVLFTVYTVGGKPGELPTDGGGVYALRTDTREITVFDRFGDILGVINTDFNIDIYTDIIFEQGCIRVKHTYATEDVPVQSALYLPTGERLE